MKRKILLSSVAATLLSVMLVGCNEGDGTVINPDSSDDLVSSTIISSGFIQGLSYTCDKSKIKNITNSSGMSKCLPNDNIIYNIGSLILPTIKQSPLININDFYTDETNKNRLQLLLEKLDQDQDYTNGIEINEIMANKISINHDISSDDFLKNVGLDIGEYIDNEDVLSHSDDFVNSLTYTPEGNVISISMDEDNTVSSVVSVIHNDDNIALTYSIYSNVSNGTLNFDDGGDFEYTPNANFNGTDYFTFVANSPTKSSTPVAVTFTINPVNDDLVPNFTNISAIEDILFNGQLTTENIDNVPVTYSLKTQSINGVTTIDSNGIVTYKGNENYNGTDSFEYSVSSGVYTTKDKLVNVNITSVLDSITSNTTSLDVNEDSTLSSTISLTNNNNLNINNVEITNQMTNGIADISKLDNNTLSINIGSLTTDKNGLDSFEYKITTLEGETFNNSVTVNLIPQKDNIIVSNVFNQIEEDSIPDVNTGTNVGILTITNIDNMDLSYTLTKSPNNSTINFIQQSNDMLNYTVTPDLNFNGTDNFEITVTDEDGLENVQSIDINVNPTNDTINITSPVNLQLDEDTQYTEVITVENIDGDNLNFELNQNLSTLNGISTITKIDDYSANITYTPNADFNGNDSINIIVNDGIENLHTIPLIINPVVDNVTFNTTDITLEEDKSETQTLSLYNPDNYTITTTILSDISNGVITINTNDNTNPSFDFVSINNINTISDLIEFKIDYTIPSIGAVSLTKEMDVTITAINDIPLLLNGGNVVSTLVASDNTLPQGIDPDVNDVDSPDKLIYEFKVSDIDTLSLNTNIVITLDDEETGEYTIQGDDSGSVQFRVKDNKDVPSSWQTLTIN